MSVGVPRWLRHALKAAADPDRIGIHGVVTAWTTDERGRVRDYCRMENTAANYAAYAVASWYTGTNNTGQGALVPPGFIAMGNGVGSVAPTDLNMFPYELYGSRTPVNYQGNYDGYTAQFNATWPIGRWNQTITDFGLWDQSTGTAAVGTGGVAAGATTLPLAAGAPAVFAYGALSPSQFSTLYVRDGSSSEYASIATSASAGGASWALQAPLQFAHAAGVSIIVFIGNLYAHTQGSLVAAATDQASVQWAVPITPG